MLVAALAAAVVLRLLAGPDGLGWPEGPALGLRLRRVLSGLIAGGALGAGGVMLQCLLRNPLASPDLLGLASGAGLGVMAATYTAYAAGGAIELAGGAAATGGSALLGAAGSLGVVYMLSQRRGIIDPASMILVGVIVGVIAGAGVMVFQQLLPDRGLSASRWLVGSIRDDATRSTMIAVGVLTIAAIVMGARLGPAMDAASLSDDEARSLGVSVGGLRLALFVASAALAAGSVMLAGVLGFVGLVAPHAVRTLCGPSHRPLVAGSALAGGALVVLADAAVRLTDIAGGRLPIGVLTSLLGGPLFLVLLLRHRRAA